ncbi:translation initiation factor 4E [Nematocida sp. AWRm80]|nr:translation initiation factor 4E [Nematocida sp. AWRm80]
MSMGIEEVPVNRHELNSKWVMWYDFQDKKYVCTDNWMDSVQHITHLETVEEFWAATEELGDIGELPVSSNLHFFREDITPMWEDPSNYEGGKWVLEIPAGQSASKIWLNTMLLCISESIMLRGAQNITETFMPTTANVDVTLSGVICGAVLSPRKNYTRISIWTSIKDNRVTRIGELWKTFADITEENTIVFKAHENALKGGREYCPDVYSI